MHTGVTENCTTYSSCSMCSMHNLAELSPPQEAFLYSTGTLVSALSLLEGLCVSFQCLPPVQQQPSPLPHPMGLFTPVSHIVSSTSMCNKCYTQPLLCPSLTLDCWCSDSLSPPPKGLAPPHRIQEGKCSHEFTCPFFPSLWVLTLSVYCCWVAIMNNLEWKLAL